MRTLTPASNITTSSKMTVHFPSGTKHQQINLDDWHEVLEAGLKDPTQFFSIPRQAVPKGKIITYGRFVVDIHPNKSETHCVRLTVGAT
jgi:hypothetical protein